MSRRRWLSLLALGAGVALLASAASASPHGESARGGELRLMWGIPPDSLDPALAGGLGGSYSLLNATCAKLFKTVYDPDTGTPRVVPAVAVDYPKITNGGRTYTFELKPTFRFHTGERVTARNFYHAFNRDADPRMKSPVALRGFMDVIVGADTVMRGKAATVSGVQVLGPYRLRIRLKRRTGDFLARLTLPNFCAILSGTPIREAGIDELRGSGPYYVAEFVENRQIVLERNRYYRGTANPDRIVWRVESDWSEKVRATEQGENDFTPLFGYPDAVVRGLADKYGVNRPDGQLSRAVPALNFSFMFNTKRRAFKGAGQIPLRKAINYALDRPALAAAHPYLTVRPSARLLPAALSKSRPLYPLGLPDLDTARRWRARAGHRPKTLTLYAGNNPPFYVAVAQVFVANMRQLGIEVDVKYFDLQKLGEKLQTPGEPWDVGWSPRSVRYPDPVAYLLPLFRGERHAARIDAVNQVTGAAARARAWADLEADLMAKDPPVAVYADGTLLALYSRNFGCWSGAPGVHAYRLEENGLDLAAVCKK